LRIKGENAMILELDIMQRQLEEFLGKNKTMTGQGECASYIPALKR
jgi:glutaminase